MVDRFEFLARELETSPNHRVLRRLDPRDVFCTRPCARPGVGIILDCETTGLDPSTAEIIELAMVKFTYSEDGAVLRVIDELDELQEPSSPIPPEITRLTGIDDAMVSGRSIDPFRVEGFLLGADIVIAHCARFDRPFVERIWPSFRTIDWACSLDQVPWRPMASTAPSLSISSCIAASFSRRIAPVRIAGRFSNSSPRPCPSTPRRGPRWRRCSPTRGRLRRASTPPTRHST